MDPPDTESVTSRTMTQEVHPPDLISNGGSDVSFISDVEDDNQELGSWVMIDEIDDILMDQDVMEVNAATDSPLASQQVDETRDPTDPMINDRAAVVFPWTCIDNCE